jgi:hypothetical protein
MPLAELIKANYTKTKRLSQNFSFGKATFEIRGFARLKA